MNPSTLFLYIGSYAPADAEGIHLLELSLHDGSLRALRSFPAGENPSYIAIDPRREYLYAVNEIKEFEGKQEGAVSSFAIDEDGGELRFLRRVPSGGAAPCYLSVSADGSAIHVANYEGGNVAVLPVEEDGAAGPPEASAVHHGSGANHERQEKPHVHSVLADPAGHHILVADLGTDSVEVYRREEGSRGLLKTNGGAEVRPGTGPRHMLVHPNGRWLYVVGELDSTVTAFDYDSGLGALREIGSISTLPPDFSGESLGADIHLEPSGRYLYASNRGHDSIALFRVDLRSGRLEAVGHCQTGGKEPRGFAIDPEGRFLVVANQKSDQVVSFRLDPEIGMPEPTGHSLELKAPSSVIFLSH